eukprot:6624740-Alexandrium_andersonii.AAC.1
MAALRPALGAMQPAGKVRGEVRVPRCAPDAVDDRRRRDRAELVDGRRTGGCGARRPLLGQEGDPPIPHGLRPPAAALDLPEDLGEEVPGGQWRVLQMAVEQPIQPGGPTAGLGKLLAEVQALQRGQRQLRLVGGARRLVVEGRVALAEG